MSRTVEVTLRVTLSRLSDEAMSEEGLSDEERAEIGAELADDEVEESVDLLDQIKEHQVDLFAGSELFVHIDSVEVVGWKETEGV